MPDLRVWGYGIRSMPTTLTHVGPLGLWGIWLSRVLYTVAPRVLNEPLIIYVSRIAFHAFYTYIAPLRYDWAAQQLERKVADFSFSVDREP